MNSRLRLAAPYGRAFFCLFAVFAAAAAAAPAAGQAQSDLRGSIAGLSQLSTLNWRDAAIDVEALSAYYGMADAAPVWTGEAGPNEAASQLLAAIEAIGEDGLEPGDYLSGLPSDPAAITGAGELARLELAMSQAALRLARDLHGGRTASAIREADIVIASKPVEIGPLLADIRRLGVPAVLVGLRPQHRQYAELRRMLASYRGVAERGGWPAVGTGPALKEGMRSPRVRELRTTLAARGYGDEDVPQPELFGEDLAAGLKRFQKHHGLTEDGIAGPDTLKALAVPAEERVRQLIVNLERWRWLPADLGRRYVMVNAAGFQMQTYEGGRLVDRRRVIVGQPSHKTPMFSDAISYAEFNPTWTPTRSIAGNEFLPKLRQNPGYLSARGYDLYSSWQSGARPINPWLVDWYAVSASRFPFRIVQRPGPKNALGRVKFMFPNQYSVYLHDTPARQLFERSSRAFSHGCIRVENPLEFAELLFRMDDGPGRSRIDAIVGSRKTGVVRLKREIPVHLTYFSTWVDEDRNLHFYEDLYGRDELVARALFGAV